MKYTRHGPFGGSINPVNTAFLNDVEAFLVTLPAEQPYQRQGPFVNGQAALSASLLNHIENFLAQVTIEGGEYKKYGPFVNGAGPSLYDVLNALDEYLVSLQMLADRQEAQEKHAISVDPSWQALYMFGSSTPVSWFDRDGREIPNPDYIAPPGRPEPVQYEQALVDYDTGESEKQ